MGIDALLAEARRGLRRLTPSDAYHAAHAGALIVDIRPFEQREHDGVIPGALIIDRNVLEWRLDPRSAHKETDVGDHQRVVVICNEGYSSSLAAATLQLLGRDATDVIGGFQGWLAGGLPVNAEQRPTMVDSGAQTPSAVASESERSISRRRHWDRRYTEAGATLVSWYQREPTMSLALIDRLGVPKPAPIIDVGGGASVLVDEMLTRGHSDVSVLDVSATALDLARHRLRDAASVHWLHEDVLSWQPERRYALWHDRAVFHFLTDAKEQSEYLKVMRQAIRVGGALIMATFAADGPDHCAGLPVARYATEDLERLLDGFTVVESTREEHLTPSGVDQPFSWIAARRI